MCPIHYLYGEGGLVQHFEILNQWRKNTKQQPSANQKNKNKQKNQNKPVRPNFHSAQIIFLIGGTSESYIIRRLLNLKVMVDSLQMGECKFSTGNWFQWISN